MAVRPRKTKVTAAFDADLVKWYRAMGHGYQARMNAVLRAYMRAVVSKEIESHGDRDWKHEQIWGLPDRIANPPKSLRQSLTGDPEEATDLPGRVHYGDHNDAIKVCLDAVARRLWNPPHAGVTDEATANSEALRKLIDSGSVTPVVVKPLEPSKM